LKSVISNGDKMKMQNVFVTSLLLFSLIAVGLANAQSTNSTSIPIFGSPNSVACTIYKSLNMQTYEMPSILAFIAIGTVIIAYEAFKKMALEKEEKEGGIDSAELSHMMSRIYTIIFLVIIIVGSLVTFMTVMPLIAC